MRHGPGLLGFVLMLFILLFVNFGLLDLAHVWTSSWTSHVHATRRSQAKEQAEYKACPRKPQERRCCLGFSAPTCGVRGAVCYVVATSVILWFVSLWLWLKEWLRHTPLLQEWAPSSADMATAAQKKNKTLRRSRPAGTNLWKVNESLKAIAMR